MQSQIKNKICGCSSVVEYQPSKLAMWVRFPSPAPEKSVRKDGFFNEVTTCAANEDADANEEMKTLLRPEIKI